MRPFLRAMAAQRAASEIVSDLAYDSGPREQPAIVYRNRLTPVKLGPAQYYQRVAGANCEWKCVVLWSDVLNNKKKAHINKKEIL